MLGIPMNVGWELLLDVVNVLPKNYSGGDLDVPTSDCIVDLFGDYVVRWIHVDTVSDMKDAELQIFIQDLVQVAMDVRIMIPVHLLYMNLVHIDTCCIYLLAEADRDVFKNQ